MLLLCLNKVIYVFLVFLKIPPPYVVCRWEIRLSRYNLRGSKSSFWACKRSISSAVGYTYLYPPLIAHPSFLFSIASALIGRGCPSDISALRKLPSADGPGQMGRGCQIDFVLSFGLQYFCLLAAILYRGNRVLLRCQQG